MKTKILEFDVPSRDGTIISKDALKNQDDKPVPLKWGTGKDAKILGTVNLEVCGDGVSMSMDKETYNKILKLMEEK